MTPNEREPKELQAVIADANAKMKEATLSLIEGVKKKIDHLLSTSGLSLGDVYPNRGGKKSAAKKGDARSFTVAPKYRHPTDPAITWTGRGRQPAWFAEAIAKRGVTADTLLINGASEKSPVKAVKKVAKKMTKKVAKRVVVKKGVAA